MLKPLDIKPELFKKVRMVALYGNSQPIQKVLAQAIKTYSSDEVISWQNENELSLVKNFSSLKGGDLFSENKKTGVIVENVSDSKNFYTFCRENIASSTFSFIIFSGLKLRRNSPLISWVQKQEGGGVWACYDDAAPAFKQALYRLFLQREGISLSQTWQRCLSHVSFQDWPAFLLKLALLNKESEGLSDRTLSDLFDQHTTLPDQGLIPLLEKRWSLLFQALSSFQSPLDWIWFLRMAYTTFSRFLELKTLMNLGHPFANAVELMPAPLFFKEKILFERISALWRFEGLVGVVNFLLKSERSVKKGVILPSAGVFIKEIRSA